MVVLNGYNNNRQGANGNGTGNNANRTTDGGSANVNTNRTVRQQNILNPETNGLNAGRQTTGSGIQDMNLQNRVNAASQNGQGPVQSNESGSTGAPVEFEMFELPQSRTSSFFSVIGRGLLATKKIIGSVLKKALPITAGVVVLKSVYDSFKNTQKGFFTHLYDNGASVLSYVGKFAASVATSPSVVAGVAAVWFGIGSVKRIVSTLKNGAENVAGRMLGVVSETCALARNTSLAVLALTVAGNAYTVVAQMTNSSVVDPIKQIFDKSADAGTTAALVLLVSVPLKMVIDAVRNSVSNMSASDEGQH